MIQIGTLIDYILHNNLKNGALSCTLDSNITDHKPIATSFKFEQYSKIEETYIFLILLCQITSKRMRKYNNLNGVEYLKLEKLTKDLCCLLIF